MAKRRRLTTPQPDGLPASDGAAPPPATARGPLPRAPIAQVAGDAALTAAFQEVKDALKSAEREGRMLLSLPLAAVQEDYLIRDRIACDPNEMAALQDSLRARGQQAPIEVTDLGQGRYGLISGWRRLRALRALAAEPEGGRFATVQALLRAPQDRPAAYLAMVEENEIRADLSFYERARITVQALREGVFDSDKQALQSLFSSVSFSKRSKIKSFIPVVEALDGVLRHPAQIPERLGLALSKALDQPGMAARLIAALHPGEAMTAEAERAILEQALRPAPAIKTGSDPAVRDVSKPVQVASNIRLSARPGRVDLQGDGVTPELVARLTDWLRRQDQGGQDQG